MGSVLAAATRAHAVFTDVTGAAGVDYVQYVEHVPPISDHPVYMSGGVAAGDVNGDGCTDLYVTRMERPGILFRNRCDGTFEDASGASGLDQGPSRGNSPAFADIDNDGDLDLYVTRHLSTRHYLFVNDGSGVFSEEAEVRGAGIVIPELHYGYGGASATTTETAISTSSWASGGWIPRTTRRVRPPARGSCTTAAQPSRDSSTT
jgi:hypothetical protein